MSLVEEIGPASRVPIKRSYHDETLLNSGIGGNGHNEAGSASSATGSSSSKNRNTARNANKKKKINYNFAALEAAAHGTNQEDDEELLSREERRVLRRFQELDKENYNEVPVHNRIEVPKEFVHVSKKQTGTVKRILNSKKQLVNYLDENESAEMKKLWMLLEHRIDESSPSEITTTTASTGGKAIGKKKLLICSICGNNSKYSCVRCKIRFCSVRCGDLHNETRCATFTG